MSHDRLACRARWVWLSVAVLAVVGGCRRSPFQRLTDDSIPGSTPDRGAIHASASPPTGPSAAAMTDQAVNRAFYSSDESAGQALASVTGAAPISPAPTPMLDAALKRAMDYEGLHRRERAEPEPPTADLPIEPAPAPVQDSTPIAMPVARASLATTPARESDAGPKVPVVGSNKRPQASSATSRDRVDTPSRAEATAPPSTAPSVKPAEKVRARSELAPATVSLAAPEVSAASGPPSVSPKETKKAPSSKSPEVAPRNDQEALTIPEIKLCRRIHGFGAFEALPGQRIKAGQPLTIYSELAGLRYATEPDEFVARLASKIQVVSSRDGKRVWDEDLGTAEDRCRRKRRDFYASYRVNLPEGLEPGSYRVCLTQTDLISGKSASSELPFELVP